MLRNDVDSPFDRLSSAVFADLESKLRTQDLLAWIDREASLTADAGIRSSAVELTPSVLARHNVTALFLSDDVPGQGYIEQRGRGLAIYVNSGLPEVTRRFTIGHELGHTLFFEHGTVRARTPLQRHHDPVVEYLCDRFAAGLLLPRERFEDWLDQQGFEATSPEESLHVVPKAARFFRVAPQAVARRMFFHFAARRCALVSLRLRSADEWVVSWCAVPGDIARVVDALRLTLPLRAGRVVPKSLVPEVSSEFKTERTTLHGLWWAGVTPQTATQSRRPMKRWPYAPRRAAWVVRTRGRMYLAMPLGDANDGGPRAS